MQQPPAHTSKIDLKQVSVRLVQAHERLRWDALMNAHHYLGFKQFAGRGLRYVAECDGEWLALVGWQTGVFQCRPRDRWLGWHKALQFRRLHCREAEYSGGRRGRFAGLFVICSRGRRSGWEGFWQQSMGAALRSS